MRNDTRRPTPPALAPSPPTPRPAGTPTTFTADDGHVLHGTWHVPSGSPRGAVLVAGAVGLTSHAYAPLASFLCTRGWAVLRFDYRGAVDPRCDRAEGGDALRWFGDAASALEHLVEEVPGVPVSWIGHSLGAQALPFARHDLLAHAVLVAAGSGYWRWFRPRIRWAAPVLLSCLVPLATALCGYFPGRRLRVVGDVPAGVMRQWARWCLSRDYFGVDVPRASERTGTVTVPITAVAPTDDELISLRSHRELESWFANADVERVPLDPRDAGVSRIGHAGFFRPALEDWWASHLVPRLPASPAAPAVPAARGGRA